MAREPFLCAGCVHKIRKKKIHRPPRIFVSHQWLSTEHPDPKGQKVKIFQETLLGMIDESLPVAEDVVSRSDDKSLSSEMRRHIKDGFIFFDWFSIPQQSLKDLGCPNNGAALAVRSIPAYVELSSLFIALVPELRYKESPELLNCNYATWLSRGWLWPCSRAVSFFFPRDVVGFFWFLWVWKGSSLLKPILNRMLTPFKCSFGQKMGAKDSKP